MTEDGATSGVAATRRWRRLITLTSGVLIAVALVRAWRLRWVCDDAFISFRYADNVVRGWGLVWNEGERVEGYTNLLWTLALIPAAAAGADLIVVSQVLGLLSLALLAGVLWRWGRATPDRPPLALWVTLAMGDVLVWATGGLETMTFTAAAAGLGLLLYPRHQPSVPRELAAGAIGAALLLLRPDGVLVTGVLGGLYLSGRWSSSGSRAAMVAVLRVGLPPVLTLAGATIFRLGYYGDLLPNTYHAKSAGEAYWRQGLTYFGLLVARNHVLAVACLLGTVLGIRAALRTSRWRPGAGAALAAAALVFTFYVVRSGGDFMFARRLRPAIPLALMAVERVLAAGRAQPAGAHIALVVVLTVLTALPYPLWQRQQRTQIAGVSDERAFYPAAVIARRRAQGEALARAFAGLDATLLFEGGLCVVAYYSRLPRMIEPNGLTDRVIARGVLAARGRPGHEKSAPLSYLRERRVQLIVRQSPPPRPLPADTVLIGDGLFALSWLVYDDAVMGPLAGRPGVRLLPIERHLEQARARIAAAPCEGARKDLAGFDEIYFRWNPAAAPRRGQLAALVASRCKS